MKRWSLDARSGDYPDGSALLGGKKEKYESITGKGT
jgi:hypothetical protein